MKWLNPKTSKVYNSVLEALVDFMCPGLCIDCPLNHPQQEAMPPDPVPMMGGQPCIKYVRDNPTQAAALMGLIKQDTLASDMTLSEVQEMCGMRAAEFGPDMCVGCVLWGERQESYREPQLPVGCKLMGRGTSPNNWQLETFITFEYSERVQLNGLKDAFGRNAVIERTASGALMLYTPEGIKIELPRTWWIALPCGATFAMEDAIKNDFAGAQVKYVWEGKQPKRMSSLPLKPDAGKAGEHTDERGMLDPQSYTKQGG